MSFSKKYIDYLDECIEEIQSRLIEFKAETVRASRFISDDELNKAQGLIENGEDVLNGLKYTKELAEKELQKE